MFEDKENPLIDNSDLILNTLRMFIICVDDRMCVCVCARRGASILSGCFPGCFRTSSFPPGALKESCENRSASYLNTEIRGNTHDQEPNGNYNQQRKPKPTQNHRRNSNTRLYSTVAHSFNHGRSRHRRCMLPQHRNEHKNGANKDDGERNLRHCARRESCAGWPAVIFLLVAGECGEQQQRDGGQDDCDDDEVGKHDAARKHI